MEADLHSGALITARKARQQDRRLYALPGRVDEAGSEGPSLLIRDGARLLTSADDILTDFEKIYSDNSLYNCFNYSIFSNDRYYFNVC
jgi:DNA processing protein